MSQSVQRARGLRKRTSPPEVALWRQLRLLKARGWHFRRQSPEPPFTLDFVCRKAKLVVEVRYDHVTGDRFRHGTKLIRFRPDKNPKQCTFEQIESPALPRNLDSLLK